MNVTCERCGTEYDFDEILLSPRGVTVKCTHCSHQFRVVGPGDPARDYWEVLEIGREIEAVRSLGRLQSKIRDGFFGQEAKIRRPGGPWKSLVEIAELEPFFGEASGSSPGRQRKFTLPYDTETNASAPSPLSRSERRQCTIAGLGPAPGASSGSTGGATKDAPMTVPPPVPEATGRPKTVPPPVPGAARPKSVPPPVPEATGRPKTVPPPVPGAARPKSEPPPVPEQERSYPQAARPERERLQTTARVDVARSALEENAPPPERLRTPHRPRAAERLAETTSPPGRGADQLPFRPTPPSDESIAPTRPSPTEALPPLVEPARPTPSRPPIATQRKRSAWPFVVTAFLLVGLGASATYWQWEHVAPLLGLRTKGERFAALVLAGDRARAEGHAKAFASAVEQYEKALQLDDTDVSLLTSMALAYVSWAQAQSLAITDLRARARGDSAMISAANRLELEMGGHLDLALRLGRRALDLDPKTRAAELAMAHALLLSGDRTGARERIERARLLTSGPDSQLAFVEILLEADREGFAAVRQELSNLVEAEPAVQGRMILARALLLSGDLSGANGQLDAVLQTVPGHPDAVSMQDAIVGGYPPAPAVVATVDAGGLADGGVVDEQLLPDAAVQDAGVVEVVPTDKDYDWYVQEAEAQLAKSLPGQARELLKAALELRPRGGEALDAMGRVALALGNPAAAAGQFRRATRNRHPASYYGLGEAMRLGGKIDEAIAAYEDYLKALPSGPQAELARRQIQTLRPAKSATTTSGAAGAPKADSPQADDARKSGSATSSSTPPKGSSEGATPAPTAPPEPPTPTEPSGAPSPKGDEGGGSP